MPFYRNHLKSSVTAITASSASSGEGVILEIGNWKGKSTISLALGSMKVHRGKVYAVDPHKPLAEEGYFEDTQATRPMAA